VFGVTEPEKPEEATPVSATARLVVKEFTAPEVDTPESWGA
jgi:hypothetical protein